MTNEEQREAKDKILTKVRDILGEHFGAYLLIVEAEAPDDCDSTQTLIHYAGGFNTAWGLAARAVRRLEVEAFKDLSPLEED